MGRRRLASVIQEVIRKQVLVAVQSGRSPFLKVAVLLADGRADGHSGEVCQPCGAAVPRRQMIRRVHVQGRTGR